MHTLVTLIELAFSVYVAIILIQVALTWLIAFEVVNATNPQAQNLMRLLERATDPLYKPLRKYIPPIGGIDITPIVVLIILAVLKNILVDLLI